MIRMALQATITHHLLLQDIVILTETDDGLTDILQIGNFEYKFAHKHEVFTPYNLQGVK